MLKHGKNMRILILSQFLCTVYNTCYERFPGQPTHIFKVLSTLDILPPFVFPKIINFFKGIGQQFSQYIAIHVHCRYLIGKIREYVYNCMIRPFIFYKLVFYLLVYGSADPNLLKSEKKIIF